MSSTRLVIQAGLRQYILKKSVACRAYQYTLCISDVLQKLRSSIDYLESNLIMLLKALGTIYFIGSSIIIHARANKQRFQEQIRKLTMLYELDEELKFNFLRRYQC